MARTGTCARPEFWRSQRSRAHKPPPQPDASPDADPQMHVWSVRCGRCARAKTSGIKVQPRHPSGCLVLNPRDPGRAVWQYPVWARFPHRGCGDPNKSGPIGGEFLGRNSAHLWPIIIHKYDCSLAAAQAKRRSAFYAPTQALRRGVQEVWAVWTEGLPLVQSAMRGHALGAVSKLQ